VNSEHVLAVVSLV